MGGSRSSVIAADFFGRIPGVGRDATANANNKKGHTKRVPYHLRRCEIDYCTVTVTGIVWLSAPDVPVIITVD